MDLVCPCLVFAFPKGDDRQRAIPSDLIEIENIKDPIALALKGGLPNILIQNAPGKGFTFLVKAKES